MVKISNLHDTTENGSIKQYGVFLTFEWKGRRNTMKIAIAGTGYVGLSNAILLAQHHEVTAVDIIEEKVEMINQRRSPLVDREIEDYLANAKLNLTATTDGMHAYEKADYVIISTPTNYDEKKNYFVYSPSSSHFSRLRSQSLLVRTGLKSQSTCSDRDQIYDSGRLYTVCM
jgi:UDP-N-acetyl-D-mannosaminuronate dehydrogenase